MKYEPHKLDIMHLLNYKQTLIPLPVLSFHHIAKPDTIRWFIELQISTILAIVMGQENVSTLKEPTTTMRFLSEQTSTQNIHMRFLYEQTSTQSIHIKGIYKSIHKPEKSQWYQKLDLIFSNKLRQTKIQNHKIIIILKK